MPLRVQLAMSLAVAAVLALPAAAQNPAGGAPSAVDPVAAIEQAGSPAEALAAYIEVQKTAPDTPLVDEAFVRRMVQLDSPLLAEKQARVLSERDPKNGLTWGVLGFASTLRGDTATAVVQLAQAARYAMQDAFVQGAAGQIVAWYDTRERGSSPTAEERRAVSQIRTLVGGRVAFAAAYRDARRVYEQAELFHADDANVEPAPAVTDEVFTSNSRGCYGMSCGRCYYGYPYYIYGYPYYARSAVMRGSACLSHRSCGGAHRDRT